MLKSIDYRAAAVLCCAKLTELLVQYQCATSRALTVRVWYFGDTGLELFLALEVGLRDARVSS